MLLLSENFVSARVLFTHSKPGVGEGIWKCTKGLLNRHTAAATQTETFTSECVGCFFFLLKDHFPSCLHTLRGKVVQAAVSSQWELIAVST